MAAGINPIYCKAPTAQFSNDGTDTVLGQAAQTAFTGTGTLGNDIFEVFTASANGGFVQKLRFKPASSTLTIVTTARVYINNGGANTTITNNTFYDDITLPAVTMSAATTAQTPSYEIQLNLALPATYRILVTFSVAQTSTGWSCAAIGGQY